MDVTRQNFYDLFRELKEAVSEASFIAIDGEFTGLNSCGRDVEIRPFDTPQQYYEKEYQRAFDFLLLQFGVCIFHFNKNDQRYSYQAYNFYVFPASNLRGCPSMVFQCQSSSIAFLAKNGFDFNKAFREGIPYMTQVTEDKLREMMQERHTKMSSNGSVRDMPEIQIPDGKKTHVENNLTLIESFLNNEDETKAKELVLKNCPPLMRRLLYQEVPKKFGDRVFMETQEDWTMLVTRNSDEIRKKKHEERKLRDLKELEDSVGFSNFIKLLSTSGKLVIGHNCLLDICHAINSFRFPLPAEYEDFKELIHHVFPRVLDTKYMAETSLFQEIIPSTVLGHLFRTVQEPPFEMPAFKGESKRCYDLHTDRSHEAGYDALLTGLSFLSMCQHLCKEKGRNFECVEAMSDILKDFENRIHLSRIQDIPFMQLGGPDRPPPRNHVFHLTFPQEWKHYEITELFKPFGPVFVSFLDDQSAFVALHKRNQADIVLRSLTKSSSYKLTPFADFQKHLNQRKPFLQTKLISTLPQGELSRKKRSLDGSDSSISNLSKKPCSYQQVSDYSVHSSGSLWEDSKNKDASGMGSCTTTVNEEKSEKSCKEFPESDEW